MTAIIELYEDRRSGWRVLTSQGGTIGYRFIIVDRAGRSTFAADATQLASGKVPAGLEQVDLDVDSAHGMDLIKPCALWRRGRVRRTESRTGVLTAAYISGEVNGAVGRSAGSAGARRRDGNLRRLADPGDRGLPAHGPQDRVRADDDDAPQLVTLGTGVRESVESELPARGDTLVSETILARGAIVPVHSLRGQHMPRTASNGSLARRRTAAGADMRLVVTQITRLVAANEQLRRANHELTEENQRLRGELTAIGSALGSLTGGRGRGRRGATALALPEAKPRPQRKPITDPEVLARRNVALAKARAARAERLTAARAAAAAE